jgi:hypothetical protein
MIVKQFIFYFILVLGASQSRQSDDPKTLLMAFQEQILSDQRNRVENSYKIDIDPIADISPLNLLKEMEFMDDCAFILFWKSGGSITGLPSKATGCRFIRDVANDRFKPIFSVFDMMKSNYKKYLEKKVLKELLSQISKAEKEELLFNATSLYNGKFRSIWMRTMGSENGKFDYLHEIFSFFKNAISLGVYGLLEEKFNELVKYYNGPKRDDPPYLKAKQFELLIGFLSTEKNENLGFRWVANHSDPLFTLSYFYFQEKILYGSLFRAIRFKREERRDAFRAVRRIIKNMMNNEFSEADGQVWFNSFFHNPLAPTIMGDDELKECISKIISKLYNFCFPITLNEPL